MHRGRVNQLRPLAFVEARRRPFVRRRRCPGELAGTDELRLPVCIGGRQQPVLTPRNGRIRIRLRRTRTSPKKSSTRPVSSSSSRRSGAVASSSVWAEESSSRNAEKGFQPSSFQVLFPAHRAATRRRIRAAAGYLWPHLSQAKPSTEQHHRAYPTGCQRLHAAGIDDSHGRG